MAAVFRKYDEEVSDDRGLSGFPRPPNRQASFAGVQIRRYRFPTLIAAVVIYLIYWTSWKHGSDGPTDWSRYAYVQYCTDVHSMCNAYMVFEALNRLGSKAERVLLYPEQWNAENDDENDRNSQLLIRAKANFGVKLKPTQLLGLDGVASPGTLQTPSTWETSITKLRIFELEQYDRILYFDNDVLLQQHLDELFLLPSTPVAMPRRYWSDLPHWDWPLSGTLMLVEPNAAETKLLWDRLQEWRLSPDRADCQTWDDDLLDDRFRSSALVLPHRPYLLQTSEFRQKDHDGYMGTFGGPPDQKSWDPHLEFTKAKLIHFNDWPLPKPWQMWPSEGLDEMQPDCSGSHEDDTCAEREVWLRLYEQFRQRRKDVCRILSVPAPHEDWSEYKRRVGAG